MTNNNESNTETSTPEQNGDSTARTGPTRRQVVAALGAGGLFSMGALGQNSGSDTDLGGGPMSSQVSDLVVEWLEGSFSDRPSAGVENRYYFVTEPNDAEYGTVYRDDGSSWNAVPVSNYWEDSGGTISPRDGQSVSADSADVANQLSAGSVSTEKGPSAVRHAASFNGADGGEQIQAAVTDLPASGGAVFIGADGPDNGLWKFSSTVSINKDNVAIRGTGLSTELKLADGADAVMFDFTNQSFISFSNLYFDGNRANQTNDQDNHVQLMLSNEGSSYCRFDKLYCESPVNNAINFEKLGTRHSYVLVSNSFFDNNFESGETGYRPGEDCVEFKRTDYANVVNCYFAEANKTPIEYEAAEHGAVIGNMFEETSFNAEAIQIGNGTDQGASRNIVVVGNSFANIQQPAIGVTGAERVSIVGNRLRNVDGPAILTISGNNTSSKDVLIMGNSVEDAGRVFRAADDTIGLHIVGNYGSNVKKGIELNNVTRPRVTNNYIQTTTNNPAVEVLGGTAPSVTENTFRNVTKHGILVDGVTDGEVSRNHIYNSDFHGVNVIGGCDDLLIRDNALRANGNSGIRVDNAANSRVVGNEFDGNSDSIILTSNGSTSSVLRNIGVASITKNAGDTLFKNNEGHDDFVSYIPYATPSAGDWYLDDGTNTGSGTRGRRVYDGNSFVDAWTL